jgi:hypothetical protein
MAMSAKKELTQKIYFWLFSYNYLHSSEQFRKLENISFVNSKSKTEGSEDRLVTAQPLMFKDKYNFRKLGHQPYHRIKAGQLKKTTDILI